MHGTGRHLTDDTAHDSGRYSGVSVCPVRSFRTRPPPTWCRRPPGRQRCSAGGSPVSLPTSTNRRPRPPTQPSGGHRRGEPASSGGRADPLRWKAHDQVSRRGSRGQALDPDREANRPEGRILRTGSRPGRSHGEREEAGQRSASCRYGSSRCRKNAALSHSAVDRLVRIIQVVTLENEALRSCAQRIAAVVVSRLLRPGPNGGERT